MIPETDTAVTAPLPILTGLTGAREKTGERSGKTAPAVVREACGIAWMASFFLFCFAVLNVFLYLQYSGTDMKDDFNLWPLLVLIPLAVGGIVFGNALRKGEPIAWRLQILFSAIGLTGFPLLTLIHILVLSRWFKPETRNWFLSGEG